MLSAANVLTEVRMVCRHIEAHELRYQSTYQRNQILAELHSHICAACNDKIWEWVADGAKVCTLPESQLAIKVPSLTGSVKQREWAKEVRSRLLGSIDAFFREIWKNEDPLALSVWQAICLIAMVPDSNYWIRYSGRQVMPASMISEAVSKIKWNPHASLIQGGSDAYSIVRKHSPTLITKIIDIDPAQMMPKVTQEK